MPYSPTTQQITCNATKSSHRSRTWHPPLLLSPHTGLVGKPSDQPTGQAPYPAPISHLEQQGGQLGPFQHGQVLLHRVATQLRVGGLVLVAAALGKQPHQIIRDAVWHDLACGRQQRELRRCPTCLPCSSSIMCRVGCVARTCDLEDLVQGLHVPRVVGRESLCQVA